MTDQRTYPSGIRLHTPVPADFDPFAATAHDLARHGLPRRPDPETEPELSTLWERKAAEYRHFEQLVPVIIRGTDRTVAPRGLGPDPVDSAGFTLTSDNGAFTSMFAQWTIPDMKYDSDAFGINMIHTFVGLGFLDVHVELTVNPAGTVACVLSAQAVGQIAIAVRPGDVMSASLCLQTNAAGTASYFFTNQTTAQTTSVSVDTGYPPAVTVDAGVTRDGVIRPGQSLARFGTVYFDELSAYNAGGHRSVTSGQGFNMVDTNGTVLATTSSLNDYAFKVTHS